MDSLLKLGGLLHLVDPTLPIGGFNHSNGLETFVLQGKIDSQATLQEYVLAQLTQSWCFNDGAYVSLAYQATQNQDIAGLIELDHHIGASKNARETREGNYKLGVRLLKIFQRYEQSPLLIDFQQHLSEQRCKGYFPIIFGMLCAIMQLDKQESLYAFYYNAAVSCITNGVKLIPLSQMAGQDILYALREPIAKAVKNSIEPNLDWLGATTIASDIRAMQHERLYSRLYMS